MGKVDIKSAYRIIPVHPSDHHLLGMHWSDKYYADFTLPFGIRSAPAIFDSVAELFHWCLAQNCDVGDLLHYLDDVFALGQANTDVCSSRRLHAIHQTAADIATPLAPEKCVGPTTCLTFLGIELECVSMLALLSLEKKRQT